MYICLHCGHAFTEPHNRYNRRWSDSDDSDATCPNCGSIDYEVAGHCIKCDEYKPLDKSTGAPNYMIGSICLDCVKKRMTKDNAFRYSWDRQMPVGRLDSDDEVRSYLSNDIYDYSEWLEAQE